jgi:hypothetical protein
MRKRDDEHVAVFEDCCEDEPVGKRAKSTRRAMPSSFVSGVELDHAQDIISDLMSGLGAVRPPPHTWCKR